VRDTGTGLPAQIEGTLFTPFVTTKAHRLGTFTVTVRSGETPKILSGPLLEVNV
jgi:signal transduction histidine kinase